MARKADIVADAGKCTGCRLCMLACSLANNRVHRPEVSFIQVEVNERDFSCCIFIDSEKCRRCLVCTEYCESGALQAVEQPAGSRAEGA